MFDFFTRIAALGIAEIDPVGAMLLFSAIVAGVRRARLVAFVGSVLVSTVLTGMALSSVGGNVFDAVPNTIWAYAELALAVVIVIWIIRSVRNQSLGHHRVKKCRSLPGSTAMVVLWGIAFGLSMVLDPTFVAAAALGAQTDDLAAVAVAFTGWVLISQFMLFALFVAYLVGADKRIVPWSKHQWHRHRRLLLGLVYAAGGIVAIGLAADAIHFLATGTFLLA
jgi:hypothetical protein